MMVTTLIDTNVLIDLLAEDPAWYRWSSSALARAADEGPVAINPIIYGELSFAFRDRSELVSALPNGIRRLSLSYHAAFLAGQAHAAYRRNGGARTSPMADFYIGGHAEATGMRLLTRDKGRYGTYFPGVNLILPEDA